MSRDVVITGLGAVSGLGVGARALWDGLVAGRTGLGPLKRIDASGFRSRLGAEVNDFSAKDFVPKSYRKAVKVMARDIELAVGAAKLAVEDAGLITRAALPEGGDGRTTYPSDRMGCHIGAGLIAAETDELTSGLVTARNEAGLFELTRWGTGDGGGGGMNNLQPLWLLKYLPNMLACHVTILHGAEGPSNTITCSEASGLLSLGESLRVIQRDAADLCFSGGAESKINLMGLLRVDLMGRLAATGETTDPTEFIRPYDPAATGGLAGEAGGIVVLEEEAKARARGARVYARVSGFGAAQSPARPDGPVRGAEVQGMFESSGEGLADAARRALEDAQIGPERIDAIVPHAAGVPTVDGAEADALRAVFGARLREIPLITLSPAVGECWAGAGALQVAAGAMAIAERTLPARRHGGRPADDLQAGPAPSRRAELKHVLVCTSALGGQNAAIVLTAAS
ncbi:MAG: hypothetical protein IT436_18515 [Phycisphaerales bacterium]|nr:hypothetical protein [Phycisphaerales bacterium]